ESIYSDASKIVEDTVSRGDKKSKFRLDAKMDKIVTSRIWGFPIMLFILGFILWLTIIGANYPSSLLASLLLDTIHPFLKSLGTGIGFPWWLNGFLFDGVYLAVAWVVAVMLPPMAI